MDKLYLVVPCYNEEEVLKETAKRLCEKLMSLIKANKISEDSKILFVNDGSKDETWNIIKTLYEKNSFIQGIKLSRNEGHQNALFCGLIHAKDECDVAISLDADLQDDVDVIDEFIEKYHEGSDIVYGVRNSRKKDSFFKRTSAEGFYKVMKLLGVDIVYNHADYRLMSKNALNALSEFNEVNLFLRGIVPLIGYKSDVVYYERHERFAGESKYPLKKMLSFAFEGITSFSIKPIKFISAIGFLIFSISILMLIYSLIMFSIGNTHPGWTSLIISIWAIGGLQLLAIGIIGEYIGKAYLETKHRPKYFVEKYLVHKEMLTNYDILKSETTINN
ncbi:MAG: glycosyltransferase family 2 protein [Oscillospiraceae bacterium]|nr:glycosyltransferase family 2 protein [Oscillospiraceae bacterium]